MRKPRIGAIFRHRCEASDVSVTVMGYGFTRRFQMSFL